jgi:TrmH family RNA methyltransferase
MGSIFAVPVARCEETAFLALAREWPGDVVGTHLAGSLDYRAAGYREPVLLVMGNEGAGLSAKVARACGKLVRIPMAGRLDRLTLAVATALMLFELRRPYLKL